jgi:DNA-binding transcriptional LysR family regulator
MKDIATPVSTGPDTELRAPDFSLRQLAYFVSVAHHQSIQKAADALHVSAPALSAAIAHLEEAFHAPLFLRRHARGLLLTEAGAALAAESRALLQQAWQLGSGGLVDRRDLHGHVRLGCLFSFAPYIVPSLVRDMAARFPRLRLLWHEGHIDHLLEGLQNGAFDLAIMYDFDVPSGIETLPLRAAPLQAVLPGSHPLLRRQKLTMQDLATEPLILLDLPRTREYMLSAFSASGVAPRIAHRVNSMGMLLGLVSEGQGYSLLNFCPPYTHSRELQCALRSPNIVVAHSHRYRFGQTAAAVVESATRLVDHLALSSS